MGPILITLLGVVLFSCLLFTDETEGRSAAGGNRRILHILILSAKSLINLTQDQEAPLQLSRTKSNVSEQAPSWDGN